ncbi:hypothetical protein ACSQ67_007175 [Phaseolus vulgaris]
MTFNLIDLLLTTQIHIVTTLQMGLHSLELLPPMWYAGVSVVNVMIYYIMIIYIVAGQFSHGGVYEIGHTGSSMCIQANRKRLNLCHCCTSSSSCKLVLSVKEKLEKEHHSLPVGKNGRDDEDMILWFLKDRKFSVEKAISKLTKAIQLRSKVLSLANTPARLTRHGDGCVPVKDTHTFKSLRNLLRQSYPWSAPTRVKSKSKGHLIHKWRQDFEVSKLTDETVKDAAQTGKGYVHDFLDINGRPVLVVVGSKHIPMALDPADDERLCVFLIEKALSKLPPGKEQILGIVDLRGFRTENADLKFLTFLFDVFYCYYPKRLGQVLFVDAPFVFKPIWQLVKPLLKSYTSLVRENNQKHNKKLDILLTNEPNFRCSFCNDWINRYWAATVPTTMFPSTNSLISLGWRSCDWLYVVRFCSAETVRKEYFTEETLPPNFRD